MDILLRYGVRIDPEKFQDADAKSIDLSRMDSLAGGREGLWMGYPGRYI